MEAEHTGNSRDRRSYNHQSARALSTSPSTNNARLSVSCVSDRVIPVTEVHKW